MKQEKGIKKITSRRVAAPKATAAPPVKIGVTEHDIREKYQQRHAELTERYYKKHDIARDEFLMLHAQCWKDLDSELAANGLLPSPPVDEIQTKFDSLDSRLRALEQKQ